MSFGGFIVSLIALVVLVLLTFFGLQLLHVGVGSLIDWLVGVAILWWLAVVTTLPWNTHFAALDVVEEARISREKGMSVPEESVAYARRLAARFKWLAIALHLGTAVLLFVLARLQLVTVGYPAAVAALALTFARPAQRAYEHLSTRLRNMAQQIQYPREDVMELRNRVQELETQSEAIRYALDESNEDSHAATQARLLNALQNRLTQLDNQLDELTRRNAREHEALTRQTTTEIAKLSEDARFLNQVRELIRFVREA